MCCYFFSFQRKYIVISEKSTLSAILLTTDIGYRWGYSQAVFGITKMVACANKVYVCSLTPKIW